jgi:uncharacterized protein YcbX
MITAAFRPHQRQLRLSEDIRLEKESPVIGRIKRIFRYPVKSMAGSELHRASLGWHGIDGDRRFAFRRLVDQSGSPWLTASRLPELLLYRPFAQPEDSEQTNSVRTPSGAELELRGETLAAELARKHGSAVQLMQLNQGIFDEGQLSVISLATVRALERESGRSLDLRRFRPNLVIETESDEPFAEDKWLGKSLRFGAEAQGPAVSITLLDERCVMINFDPETAEADGAVMKAAVRLNANNAGVYGMVIHTGELKIDQQIYLI